MLRHHVGVHTRVLSADHAIHPWTAWTAWEAWEAWRLEKAEGLAGIDWAWSSASSICGVPDPHGMSPRSMQAQARLTSSLSCRPHLKAQGSRLNPQSVASIRDTARAGPQGRGRWCRDETAQHWHSPSDGDGNLSAAVSGQDGTNGAVGRSSLRRTKRAAGISPEKPSQFTKVRIRNPRSSNTRGRAIGQANAIGTWCLRCSVGCVVCG